MIDSSRIPAFNEQFLKYCGTNVKGTSVFNLISIVKASNVQNPDLPVEIVGVGNPPSTANIDREAEYTVTEQYALDDGHIAILTISPTVE